MYKIRTIAVLIALLLWLVTLTGCSFPRYSPGLNLPRNERESGDFSQLSDGTVTYPGAIQYFGPSSVCDITTRTLALEKGM